MNSSDNYKLTVMKKKLDISAFKVNAASITHNEQIIHKYLDIFMIMFD
jgi:hypothetical protein